MRFGKFCLGSLRIDNRHYEYDVVIDRGEIHDCKKKPSKKFRDDFGHTPLSIAEDIPWKCRQLVIGTGAYGRLPVMKEVEREARRHKVKLPILPTIKAVEVLARTHTSETGLVSHSARGPSPADPLPCGAVARPRRPSGHPCRYTLQPYL
jgi:hypothetical protein